MHLPNSNITSLLADTDGRLWVGTRGELAHWNDELAEAMGAEVAVWSSHGNGTEVGLRVPAAIAYAAPRAIRPRWFNRTSIEVHERDSTLRGR